MCGIVGYVGGKRAVDVLLNGLKRLEYRGYDSAGIAVVADKQLHVLKHEGKVRVLEQLVYSRWDEAFRETLHAGIAHTRWATHGSPTEANAHPHADQSGRLAMVHNGIIENYAAIRRQLEAKGHKFISQTDSEALIHLIGELYQGELVDAVCAALKHVEGTYGIAVVSADEPDRIVVARKGSPLVIGIGDGETIVASDVAAIIAHTRQVIYLEDDDVAVLTAQGADVRNIHNIPVSHEVAKVDWDVGVAEKGGYEHFMLKEILEQPEALANTLRGRLDESMGTAILSGLALTPRELSGVRRVIIVACGTSLHAGMIGKYYFEELADLPTEVEQAAEYRYRNPIIQPDDMVVAISQSGETADILEAYGIAKAKQAKRVGVVNVMGSSIARQSDVVLPVNAGPEKAVASTKATTAQLAILTLLAYAVAGRLDEGKTVLREAASAINDMLNPRYAELIARIAKSIHKTKNLYVIGRAENYAMALEASIKLMEVSYIHAQGFAAGELKHGPLALIEKGAPLIAFVPTDDSREDVLNNVQEVKARGGLIIGVSPRNEKKLFDFWIRVPEVGAAQPIVNIIPIQLLAYHLALLRKNNPDMPRNLAKSVTVK